jgi:glycosyltransferase involved in cell wall biosynthesis
MGILLILMISTYPPTRCGVAHYTYELVKRLKRKAGVILLTDKEWKRNDPLLPLKVLRKSLKCDIVHVQHEFALYGYPLILGTWIISASLILLKLKKLVTGKPRKIVVTMHTVPEFSRIGVSFLEKHGPLALPLKLLRSLNIVTYKVFVNLPDDIIVHTPMCKSVLANEVRTKARLHAIPHGLKALASPRASTMEGPKLMIFGFITSAKDYETILHVMNLLPESVHLYIRGGIHPHDRKGVSTKALLKNIVNLARNLNIRDRVHIELGFVDKHKAFSDIDVVILPYKNSLGASGVLCDAISHGKLFITSDTSRFVSLLKPYGWRWFMRVNFPESFVTTLKDLLTSYNEALDIIKKLQRNFSWDKVVSLTFNIYQNRRSE